MANKIEFVDLKKQYATIKAEVDEAMNRVISAGAFIGGKAVEDFEAAFAQYCGTRYCVSVANGTDALQLVLRAMGVQAGDEVITVSHTFIATVAAILMVGATPVFADIDPDSYCMRPDTLEKFITPRTKAIIPVHIYGQPADMDPIMEIAARHNLKVLEDACQAHGAKYKGRTAGSLGHAAAFSFYPGKNLGAYGDGGGITTNDEALAQALRQLRDHGRTGKYEHALFGYNSRLDGVQAAVLNVKLGYLDKWNTRRREIAARYAELLSAVPSLVLPLEKEFSSSVYHLYVVRTSQRSLLQTAFNENGIAHGIHYPIPVHLQPAWQEKFPGTYPIGSMPMVEMYADEILSLPIHPDMTDAEVELVGRVVKETLLGLVATNIEK